MELNVFMQKFLPNMVERIKAQFPERLGIEQESVFFYQNFPEALQNFADRICEMQREYCAEGAQAYIKYSEEGIPEAIVAPECILRIEQPEIEEI